MLDAKQTKRLARSANEVKKYRYLMKLLPAILCCLIAMAILTYAISALYDRYGSFTVAIDRMDTVKYLLSISETPDFAYRTSRLNAKASTDIMNIDGNENLPPPEYLDSINGQHNGKNYMAYTFYMRNMGSETITFEYELYIANVINRMDEAVRVRLYINGEYETYARMGSNGKPEPGTVPFLTTSIITRDRISDYKSGDITKFTVVVWLEGPDPECNDDLRGGQFKIDMKLSIIDEEG